MRPIIFVALLFVSTAMYSAVSDPCALTASIKDAGLQISIANGKSTFREGEIIPLILSFTSTAHKRYWADVRNYDRSGRLDIETYCVEPVARDPLTGYFQGGSFMGGGLGSQKQLSREPFTATAELNEWRQPGPGHYRLYVVSHRVWRPPDVNEATPYGRVSETLRSNTIEFDVVKAYAEWRAKQLRDATAAFTSAPSGKEREAARPLRFLNTQESAETLARLFWGLNDQPGGWELMMGLFGSPYQAVAIAAMQREVSNPDHVITSDYLHTLVRLQITADPKWTPPAHDPAHTELWQQFWQKRQAHERELMKQAAAMTVMALPKKTAKAHAQTIGALVESGDLLDATTAAQMRKQLVAAWSTLPENTRQQLIEYRWASVAGPEMLPVLLQYVAQPAPSFATNEGRARNAALKHIYEYDPAKGRALILRDLQNTRAQPALSLVKLLSPEELKTEVQQAIARVQRKDARELDYHLLELYGDESALPGVKAVFNAHLGEWACDPQDAMLRYFLRVDPEFGTKAAEESLAARKVTGCYRMMLQDLGKSLPRMQQVAIRALDDPDLEVANDAALALGRWGTVNAEPALWARLKRFHQEWQGHEGELRVTPDYNSPVARATGFESTLANAIATGTNWICGPEKFARLRALASPREQMQVDAWSKLWEPGEAVIQPNWYPEEQLSFGVLQYSNLDDGQFRAKLSQMPNSMKLYFQMWKPGQISPPVPMERQQGVFEVLRNYALQFGVTIEEKISQ